MFSVDTLTPLLVLTFQEFERRWIEIEQFLGSRFLRNPSLRKFSPGFGVALARLGYAQHVKIVMLGMQLNLFARISDELMTASANTLFADKEHCVSVDFHPRFLAEILAVLPSQLSSQFRDALNRAPFKAAAEMVIELDAELTLANWLIMAMNSSYL